MPRKKSKRKSAPRRASRTPAARALDRQLRAELRTVAKSILRLERALDAFLKHGNRLDVYRLQAALKGIAGGCSGIARCKPLV